MATGRRYTKERMSELGETIFARDVQPHLRRRKKNDFVGIDVETGAYEIGADEMEVCDRLRARNPEAQVWMRRVGYGHIRHFGGRLSS